MNVIQIHIANTGKSSFDTISQAKVTRSEYANDDDIELDFDT